jgi:hypothetical protein
VQRPDAADQVAAMADFHADASQLRFADGERISDLLLRARRRRERLAGIVLAAPPGR